MELMDIENILYEINKSKFLGFAYRVSNAQEVEDRIDAIKQQHSKATHICYAYVLSNPNLEKCSDDGEPDGTAGRPILEVVKKHNLSNTLVVVVRYFGGIKLGAGGLLRAYSTTAKNTIDSTSFVEYIDTLTLTATMPISARSTFNRFVDKYSLEIVSRSYDADYTVVVETDKVDLVDALAHELSRAGIKLTDITKTKKRRR